MNSQNDKLFQLSLLTLLAMYGIMVNFANVTGRNIFPQFDITSIGNAQAGDPTGYTLRFIQLDGAEPASPLYFDDAADSLTVDNMSEARELITQMGIAAYAEDSAELERMRRSFEDQYFAEVQSADYELILRVANPVEKYNWETDIAEQIMGRFQFSTIQAAVSDPIPSTPD